MANRLSRAFYGALGPLLAPKERADPQLNINQWASFFNYGGSTYPFFVNGSLVGNKETIPHSFMAYANSMYKSNGAVFAVEAVRLMLFSEARFQFQQIRGGRPGALFGTQALSILETPWSGATTGDLLARAIQDVDIGGNFYGVLTDAEGVPMSKSNQRGGQQQIKRLRPDWTSILLGSPQDLDTDTPPEMLEFGAINTETIAYIYRPEGGNGGAPVQTLNVEDVVHFAPIPDPIATFRGMSWLTPVMREIMSDSAATNHKLAFFENGATPNLVVSMDPSITEKAFEAWIKVFRQEHEGVANAYKTMYLAGGATPTVIGSDLKQMDFKVVQGAGETRIAAAAGVPPVIAGLSEGLQSATYSNYQQARRRFADGTMRPLWRNFAGSLERIVPPPPNSRLWYDDRDIPFLQEDKADAANILYVKSEAISKLVMAGYDPESVIEAVEADDLSQLEHTGLFSVQLRPPSPDEPTTLVPSPTPLPAALPAPAQAKLPAPAGPAVIAAPNGNGKGKEASARLLQPWLPGERDGKS
jgi:hypothetical protein